MAQGFIYSYYFIFKVMDYVQQFHILMYYYKQTSLYFGLRLWHWRLFLFKNTHHLKLIHEEWFNFTDNVITFRMAFQGRELIFWCIHVKIQYLGLPIFS